MTGRFRTMFGSCALVLMSFGFIASLAIAGPNNDRASNIKIVVPEYIQRTRRVNAEEVIALIGSEPELIVIDSRLADDRLQGFLEGSISLPNTETSCDSLENVISNNDTPALFYCNGVKCGRSSKAIKIALQCGYSNLLWFRGGIEEWKGKEYPLVQ